MGAWRTQVIMRDEREEARMVLCGTLWCLICCAVCCGVFFLNVVAWSCHMRIERDLAHDRNSNRTRMNDECECKPFGDGVCVMDGGAA